MHSSSRQHHFRGARAWSSSPKQASQQTNTDPRITVFAQATAR